MHYIVGLGNPGTKYENTRHNVGFLMVQHFRNTSGFPNFVSSGKYAGKISEGVLDGEEVILLMPDTYMNKSGSSVVKLVPKQEAEHLIVMYDDVDLALGEIKISFGKGSGGHNGIESIASALGTKEFTRVRIGIARKSLWTGKIKRPTGERMSGHVLGQFTKREENALEKAKERAVGALHTILTEGVEKAMNEYNSNE